MIVRFSSQRTRSFDRAERAASDALAWPGTAGLA
jgi:hypothetical protein